MSEGDYSSGNKVKLVHGGVEYFQQLADLIRTAKKVLHLQVYIFETDATGRAILNELKGAVERGVSVFLVVDGFGSYGLRRQFKGELEESGIQFRFFSSLPFQALKQPARRLHHKICIADGIKALLGGINIADKYHGKNGELPWLDYAVLVEGKICTAIQEFCESIFNRSFMKRRYPGRVRTNKQALPDGIRVRLSINDWLRRKNEISAAYKYMLNGARKDIVIVASYFIPTRRLLKILLRAAKRQRKVTVILGETSDVPFIRPAMYYLYGKLLSSNIRIFEYREAVLHAKVCVVDHRWVSIGSHNLNHLSEFFSVEANLEILDKTFASQLADELNSLMLLKCKEVDKLDFERNENVFRRIWNRFSYTLISTSMRILDLFNVRERLY